MILLGPNAISRGALSSNSGNQEIIMRPVVAEGKPFDLSGAVEGLAVFVRGAARGVVVSRTPSGVPCSFAWRKACLHGSS